MNKEEKIRVVSNQDKLELGVIIIYPDEDKTIKGIVQISHGMSEHKERYLEFMNYLADNGYVSIINDHRGHGESIKTKEDLGYFYNNGAINVVEDLHQITLMIKERFPNIPLYLFGHSMGSLIVRAYTKKYDYELNGLIVCGSPSFNKSAKMGRAFVKLMKIIKGDRYRSTFIDNIAFKGYNDKFIPAESDKDWICSNKDTVKKYLADEYCGFIFTLNGFETLFNIMIDVYNKNNWICKNTNLQILFIAGDADPVIIDTKNFEEAYTFMKNIGYKNIDSKLYKDKRHEILNEDIKQEVYKDILEFINKNN